MSTQIITMSKFGDTLITLGLKIRVISLKIYVYVFLMIDSTTWELIETLVFSIK